MHTPLSPAGASTSASGSGARGGHPVNALRSITDRFCAIRSEQPDNTERFQEEAAVLPGRVWRDQ